MNVNWGMDCGKLCCIDDDNCGGFGSCLSSFSYGMQIWNKAIMLTLYSAGKRNHQC